MYGERFTIRRKMLKLLGAAFYVLDQDGRTVGFCDQKAFRLKEDIRVFTGEDKSQELLVIQARNVVDFSASYDVSVPGEGAIGLLRRRGMKSLLRDSWEVCSKDGALIGTLEEDSALLALVRRFATNLIPQTFHLKGVGGAELATLKQRFNPFIPKLDVIVHDKNNQFVRDELVVAAAVLLSAIEGRQN